MTLPIRCIIVDDEPTARDILKIHLSQIANIHLIAVCKNAVEAFQVVSTQTVDLILLDINMPNISGLSFAKSISSQQKIIFTTAYREFAVDGFDLRAVDYLLKPISFERLLQALEHYTAIHLPVQEKHPLPKISAQEGFIFVRSDRKMVKVVFSTICYIESFGDYLKIHCPKQSILTRQTLSNMAVQLPPTHFIRIHRSFMINIDRIESFSKDQIAMMGQSLPISRGYKKEVLACLEAMK
ncbi:MAG: LytR/AlgR family response regulator transcription factor [Aureispira sp.]